MSDHITNDITDDIAIASAVRTFLASPAIVSLLKALVTEATTAEVQRLMASSLILDNVTVALRSPSSPAQSRLSDTIGSLINEDIAEATRDFLTEDAARDFIRDELESEPRYFRRAVETAVDCHIDPDSLADTVKDKVIEDIDLGDDIASAVGSYFDDDDNVVSLARKVVDNISVSVKPGL
jgi:hypothetical protein